MPKSCSYQANNSSTPCSHSWFMTYFQRPTIPFNMPSAEASDEPIWVLVLGLLFQVDFQIFYMLDFFFVLVLLLSAEYMLWSVSHWSIISVNRFYINADKSHCIYGIYYHRKHTVLLIVRPVASTNGINIIVNVFKSCGKNDSK